MNSLKTIATASVLALSVFIEPADAWEGTVTFYDNAYFSGRWLAVKLRVSDRCINIGCFNDRASSATWANLPTSGSFDGESNIVFFTDKDCTGSYRQWRASDTRFPANFALDGINDAVTSFKVMEHFFSDPPPPYTVCPFPAVKESGVLSNSTTDATFAVSTEEVNETSMGTSN